LYVAKQVLCYSLVGRNGVLSRAVLFHGTYGTPESNWLPWLSAELSSLGVSSQLPLFPTPENQSLLNWFSAFEQQVGSLSEDMILIGHSMGCGMILRLLERSETSVEATFLVSGWTGLLDLPDFDPLIESFFVDRFDWQAIRARAGSIFTYHGDDDPYVPLDLGKQLAGELGVVPMILPGGGHINSESGFDQFSQLLSDVRGYLNHI